MQHSNFVNNQMLRAELIAWSGGTNVALLQSAGSMAFQFSMTPDQSRALAADLLVLADRVDSTKMLAVGGEVEV